VRLVSSDIVTPEAVVLDVERAGVASRLLAITIDVLALILVWIGLALAVGWILNAMGESADSVAGAIVAVLFSLGLYLAWFCLFETVLQRTPGKAALGLRVVSLDGTPIRFQQAFLRAVLSLVDFFLIPIGFVAVVTTLLSPRDQRLGDLAAGTLVVRERTVSGLLAPAAFPPPWGYEGYVASLDLGGMTSEQYGVVRNFLLRAHHLAPGARAHLAVRLANPLSGVLRHYPPPNLHPELFLVCVAAAWQRAHAPVPPNGAWPAAPAYGAPHQPR
jgi:uncharacterized RDD family membrane protein YckC